MSRDQLSASSSPDGQRAATTPRAPVSPLPDAGLPHLGHRSNVAAVLAARVRVGAPADGRLRAGASDSGRRGARPIGGASGPFRAA